MTEQQIAALAEACWKICEDAAFGAHLERAFVLRPVVLPRLAEAIREASRK